MENKVKDGNYYVVQSFMVKELGLKGLEKDVYAIIYGFTQAENQWFDGSLQYLADWTCSTKQGVLKALSYLFEKGLIDKQDNLFNGVKFVKYRSTEFNGGVKQSLTGGIKLSLTNNIDSNNIDNNNIYTETSKVLHCNDKVTENIKHKYGEYKHVLLKDSELKKLKEQYCNWQDLIKCLDEAIELKGYKYKSHYLAIKKWVVDAVNKDKTYQKREYKEKDLNSLYDDIDNVEI